MQVNRVYKMKPIIEARFTCNSVVPSSAGSANTHLSFNAVYDSNGVNASFSKSTPYGNLVMGVDEGTLAANVFERGKTYKLTLQEVEAGE